MSRCNNLRTAKPLGLEWARARYSRRPLALAVVCLVAGALMPTDLPADHPDEAPSKRFIRVEILAPPNVPKGYVAALARIMELPLAGRRLSRGASALLEIDRRGNVEQLMLTESTGEAPIDDALLSDLRRLAPFPVPAQNDYGNLRCVVRWSPL